MKSKKYSSQLPTEPGEYFFKTTYYKTEIVAITVRMDCGVLVCDVFYKDGEYIATMAIGSFTHPGTWRKR